MIKKLLFLILVSISLLLGCKKELQPDEYAKFLTAMHNRDYKVIKKYIDTYNGIMDISFDVMGESTVLIAAIGLEDDKMVNLFLDEGINLETQLSDGTTALHIVVKDGFSKYIEILIDAGANFQAKDNSGYTIFHYALYNSSIELLDFLYEYSQEIDIPDDKNVTPLLLAMNDDREGLEEIILWFLKKGASYEKSIQISPDIPPLYINVHRNKVVKYLIENEPSFMKYEDNEGNTISHYSVGYGNYEILDYLFENNLYSHEKNDKGETPLDLAIMWELPEMADKIRNYLAANGE